jgi:hypothetical protein
MRSTVGEKRLFGSVAIFKSSTLFKPVELFCDIPESVLILYQFLRDIHPAEMIGNLGEQTSIHLDPKQPTP